MVPGLVTLNSGPVPFFAAIVHRYLPSTSTERYLHQVYLTFAWPCLPTQCVYRVRILLPLAPLTVEQRVPNLPSFHALPYLFSPVHVWPPPRPLAIPSFLFVSSILPSRLPISLESQSAEARPRPSRYPPVTCHQLPATRDSRHNCLDAHVVVAGVLFNLTLCASRF